MKPEKIEKIELIFNGAYDVRAKMPFVYKILKVGDKFETSKECYENELKTKKKMGTNEPMYIPVEKAIKKPESDSEKIKEI